MKFLKVVDLVLVLIITVVAWAELLESANVLIVH